MHCWNLAQIIPGSPHQHRQQWFLPKQEDPQRGSRAGAIVEICPWRWEMIKIILPLDNYHQLLNENHPTWPGHSLWAWWLSRERRPSVVGQAPGTSRWSLRDGPPSTKQECHSMSDFKSCILACMSKQMITCSDLNCQNLFILTQDRYKQKLPITFLKQSKLFLYISSPM